VHVVLLHEVLAKMLKNYWHLARRNLMAGKSKKKGAMKGCNVGNKCKSKKGGLTEKGRKRINAKTGSKLKAPVTGKVKPGSKDAGRRKSFCARSKSWTGERGKAARRRWKC